MTDALLSLMLFTAKLFILAVFVIALLIVFFVLLAKSKDKLKGQLIIKHLNKKYDETREELLAETLSKKQFKQWAKERKQQEKSKKHTDVITKKIYVLTFNGDIKASAVTSLREEVTAILNIATPSDEVVLRLDSAGGVVHGYGLAAAQLMRFRTHRIPLTIAIDKIAASGGYMMASVANKIYAAPFAIIGSIGVIVQLPNFNRVLKDKHIEFEQLTAGEYKRTLTIFGENTHAGREKLQHEIEEIHQLFKNMIKENRPQLDVDKVATGEHWLGKQAIELKLVDEIKTSDEYLLERSKESELFEINYEMKKPFLSKLSATAHLLYEKFFSQEMRLE
jgi:serine protease SohB